MLRVTRQSVKCTAPGRSERRSVSLVWGLCTALVVLGLGGCSPESPRLEVSQGVAPTIPHPALDALEAPLAEALAVRRSELDELLGRPALPAAERAQALGRMGQLYQAHRLLEAAAACYRQAHALDPEFFDWAYYKGVLAASSGHVEAAAEAFLKALAMRPGDLPTMIRLADLELDRGRTEVARGLYERAGSLDASLAAAEYGLGRVAASRREFEVAIEHFDRALAIQPNASVIHYNLGQAYRQLRQLERAETHLAMSGKRKVAMPDPLMHELTTLGIGASPHLSQGNALSREGRLVEAAVEYRRAVEAGPSDPRARQSLASVLARLGDLEGAAEHFTAAVRLEPDNARALSDLGVVLGELGENEQALVHLRRAVELEPDLEKAQLNLANAHARAGRYNEAVATYRRVLEIDASSLEGRSGLGMALAQLGDLEQGVIELRQVVSEAPSNPQALLNLAVALAESGDLLGAATEYRRALELPLDDRLNSLTHFSLAELLVRVGELEVALGHYTRVRQIQPEQGRAWLREATVLMGLKRFADSLAVLEERLQAAPEDARAAQALARLLASSPVRALRDGPRALAMAAALLEADNAPPHAETTAMALAEVGRFEEALQIQGALVGEARRLDLAGEERRLARNLALYEQGQACCARAADTYPPY